jgi:hypothetical protein
LPLLIVAIFLGSLWLNAFYTKRNSEGNPADLIVALVTEKNRPVGLVEIVQNI